ncbi:MAG TPA: glycosyltransferase family 2 protein [Solirubrobacteraceae bacterium]|nr:glycosyltransferase family 2 protein [Solirubrobacteraceae bacterium]
MSQPLRVAAVVPSYDGRDWLARCLPRLAAQSRPFDEIVVVDDGSSDGTAGWLRAAWPHVRVVEAGRNGGFARAANRGVAAAGPDCDAVALINNDVELEPAWLEHAAAALEGDPGAAAVATKMVSLADPSVLDDCGDVLRRDGICEQRGRGRADDGRWDEPGEVFGACAGAALFRRAPFAAAGGFEERFGAYLEDVDLALRLRLGGWRCRYEPRAVARHFNGASADGDRIVAAVERNTLLLCARAFPARWWLGPVLYRQLARAARCAQGGELRAFLAGAARAVPALPAFVGERRALRRGAVVPIERVVPARAYRGPRAGGHPASGF